MKIGVSGASGNLGTAVVNELKARAGGHTIVAITRSPEKASAGVEARFGDYDKPESLREAYSGLDRLVLIPTTDLAPGQRAKQNVAAIDAAVAAGVKHIVVISGAGSRKVPDSNIASSYFVSEQHLMRKAAQWTVLRMNYFAESFAQEAQMSLAHGVITGVGENKVGFVSRDDLAAAIAGTLTTEGHDGAIYHISGPAVVSGAERAAAVAKASGKEMAFLVLPSDVLRGQLSQMGLPTDVVNTVISIQENFVAGDFNFVTGDLERLAGKPPRSLEDVLAKAFGG